MAGGGGPTVRAQAGGVEDEALREILRGAARLGGCPSACLRIAGARGRLIAIGMDASEFQAWERAWADLAEEGELPLPDADADGAVPASAVGLRIVGSVPLTTPVGTPVATLVVLDRQTRELTADAREGLAAMGRAALAVLAGKDQKGGATPAQEEPRLRHLVERTSAVVGEPFLDALVGELREALPAHTVFVGELTNEATGEIAIHAVSTVGDLAKGTRYTLEGTPSATVVDRHVSLYRKDVQTLFPDDPGLRDLEAVGYVAVPLFDSRGHALGLIAAITAQEITSPEWAVALLDLLAFRAATEIERSRALLALERSEERYRAVISSMADGFLAMSETQGIVEVNDACCQILGHGREELLGRRLEDLDGADGEALAGHLARVQARGSDRFELRWRSPQNALLELELSVHHAAAPRMLFAFIRDISVQYRERRALEQGERLHRSILQSIPVGMHTYRLEADGRLVFCGGNPAADRILGVSDRRLVGKTIEEAFPGLVGTELPTAFRRVAEEGAAWTADQFVLPGGNPPGAFLIEAFQTGPREVVAVFFDVSAQRRTELALRDALDLNRGVLSASTLGILAYDEEGHCVLANEAVASMLGMRRSALLSFGLREGGPLAEAGLLTEADEVLSGENRRGDVELRTGDGRRRWFEWQLAPFTSGARPHLLAVFHDVTERKRAEQVQAALYRIGELAARGGDMSLLYSTIHGIVGDMMDARNFYIALYEPSTDTLRFPYFTDEMDAWPTPRRPGRSLTAYVLRTKLPLLCSPTTLASLTARGDVEVSGTAPVDWLGVPLRRGTDAFGVMAVQTYGQQTRYTEGDRDLLTFVSQHVSTAIERRRATEALRESEERHRRVFESALDGLLLLDLDDGVFRFANPAMAELVGCAPEALLGRSLEETRLVDDPAALQAEVQGLFHQGHARLRAVRLRGRDNAELLCDLNLSLVHISGRPHALFVCRDVTQRQRAEGERDRLQAALQRAALEWRLTFDTVEVAMVIVDSSGKVVRLNQAAQRAWGQSFEALLGKTLADISEGEPWRTAAALASESARVRETQTGLSRDEDRGRSYEVMAAPLPGIERADPRVIVVVQEVTRTVQLQDSVRRAQTMASMGALVGGVAHEVRNPLFAISTNIDALEASVPLDEIHIEIVDALRRAVARLTHLMEDLLDYGRTSTLSFAVGRLQEPIAAAIRACTPLARKGGVSLEDRTADDPCLIHMDRSRIEQVFANLIDNAVHHAPEGTTVVVDAERFLAQGRPFVRVTVSDAGPGFRVEDLERSFEPFFTRRRGGTGLGLSIVERIVDAHEGHVRAANKPEGGALLTVELPLAAN